MADIVADCTDSWVEPMPPSRRRKKLYLATLPEKPRRSPLVSLADQTHNASAILRDYRMIGEEI